MVLDLTEPQVFLDYLTPLIRVLKIFGFHSMTFYRANPKDYFYSVKVTYPDIFWLIFSTSIYSYFIFKNVNHRLVFSVNDSPIASLSTIFLFVGFIFQSVGCAVMNFLNRRKILKLFNQMLYVDKAAKELGFQVDFKGFGRNVMRRYLIAMTLSMIIWVSGISVFWMYKKEIDNIQLGLLVASYLWIYTGYFLFFFNFMILIQVGLERYIHLSQMVE